MSNRWISFQGVSDTLVAITRYCRAKRISPSYEARIAEELFSRTFPIPETGPMVPSEQAIDEAWGTVQHYAAQAWASRQNSEFIRDCRRRDVPLVPVVQFDVARLGEK